MAVAFTAKSYNNLNGEESLKHSDWSVIIELKIPSNIISLTEIVKSIHHIGGTSKQKATTDVISNFLRKS